MMMKDASMESDTFFWILFFLHSQENMNVSKEKQTKHFEVAE